MTTADKTIQSVLPQDVVISARSCQTELMEQAKTENLIVCLPTGCGKTYIAVMLIKEMSHMIRESIKRGGKRTIFLVKTVQLVQQQSEYIKKHTDLTVGIYYGALDVDLWEKERWEDEFENHQVLVFTAKVFVNLIDHNYFSMENVNLIIFDECHHATGDDDYPALMNKHYDKCSNPPRVLGLTASISAKKIKPERLLDTARALEKTYRARIESGSNRNESFQHGTSVQVEPIKCTSYSDEILKDNESLSIPFYIISHVVARMDDYLSERKVQYSKIERDLSQTMLTTDYRGENIEMYNDQSKDYTEFIQSQCVIILNIKHWFESLIAVGRELGLYGLLAFARNLRLKLKVNPMCLSIVDSSARELVDSIIAVIDCLVDDILSYFFKIYEDNDAVLFSSKVQMLLERIMKQNDQNTDGKCIVFVERIYTATYLSRVLKFLISSRKPAWNSRLKIAYVTGINESVNDTPMTTKTQRENIKAFRSGDVNVLIATAVVEEGLDIPECDLVIRFNKPNNFSSYMQSKGRARAKENASYVLFMNETRTEDYLRDKNEYDNYERIEQMIRQGFSSDDNEKDLRDDLAKIPPFCPKPGVVINATRAAELIMEYCVLLGNGNIFPPRFLFNGNESPYKCILSMPANCPVREDITSDGKRKKLAKYQCCLKMVEKLYTIGEFNEHCLPNRNRILIETKTPIENRIFELIDQLFEEKSDSSFEHISKQIARFPLKADVSSINWHLYQINDQLGFIVPCELMKLPKFNLYELNNTIEIQITYLKSIEYHNILTDFCRYLFEHVFDDMNTNTILQFNIKETNFKLLPCLLTRSGEIDYNRMRNICNRKNKFVQHYSELDDNELYNPFHLPNKQYYINISDASLVKRASDLWINKNSSDDIKTYADYFESKMPNIRINRNSFLATMKGIKKARINFLKQTPNDLSKKVKDSEQEPVHYPIEFLHYAPLNRQDFEMIYKLPSILIRISQLYRIELLRKKFAEHVKSYPFLDADQMPTVTFNDCLRNHENQKMILLPLTSLTYESPLTNLVTSQPSPDILFQAVTRRSTDENTDMENLEILGDCFLKLAVSMCLYHRYPSASAGALTDEKANQISNSNLYRIAVLKNLKYFVNITKINFRGEDANWIPPGYVINHQYQTEIDLDRYYKQTAKRKAFADMIEGLIGAFLVSTNYAITMQFMKWLGIDVIPIDEKEIPSILYSHSTADQIIPTVNRFYKEREFSSVEKIINYEFNNKAYLIAAFTHPSNFSNRLTHCYERLEFLGDAVLDFLVTRHIFVKNKDISPGRVTDIRQDLSNNGRLAYILVAYHLHTKILHNSPDLFGKISGYVGDEALFPKDSSTENKLNKDIDQWADSTAPKALADVFEALVGAIFLDSNKCLETVWNVVEPLLRHYIDRSITDPNLNPIRSFFESGGKVISETAEIHPEKQTSYSICIVETPNGLRFEGYGDNKKTAKFEACRQAVKSINVFCDKANSDF